MNNPSFLLIFCVLVVLSLSSVECCSCQWTPPERHYCESDFVVLIIAKNESESNDFIVYDIDLWRIYRSKNGDTDEALMTKQIWTRAQDSLCGINLTMGEPYIVSGYVIDSKPRISICGYNQLWNEITVEEETGFIKEYKKNCETIPISSRFLARA